MPIRYYQLEQIIKNKMGGTYSTCRKDDTCFEILLQNLKGREHCGKHRRRLKDVIQTNVNELNVRGRELSLYGAMQSKIEGAVQGKIKGCCHNWHWEFEFRKME